MRAGVFPTPINRAAITGTPRGDWMIKQTPMDRFGEPQVGVKKRLPNRCRLLQVDLNSLLSPSPPFLLAHHQPQHR